MQEPALDEKLDLIRFATDVNMMQIYDCIFDVNLDWKQ